MTEDSKRPAGMTGFRANGMISLAEAGSGIFAPVLAGVMDSCLRRNDG